MAIPQKVWGFLADLNNTKIWHPQYVPKITTGWNLKSWRFENPWFMMFPFQTGDFFPGIAVSFLRGSSSSIASCWLSCVECWNHTFKKYWNQFGTSMPKPLAKGSFELFWGCIFGLVWSHVLGSTSWESGVFHIKKATRTKTGFAIYVFILYIHLHVPIFLRGGGSPSPFLGA